MKKERLSADFFVNPNSKWSIVFFDREFALPDVFDDGTTPRIGRGTTRIYIALKGKNPEVEEAIRKAVEEGRFIHRVFETYHLKTMERYRFEEYMKLTSVHCTYSEEENLHCIYAYAKRSGVAEGAKIPQ